MLIRKQEDLYCDVLVVGGSGAGLRAAIAARSKGVDVLLVSKTRVGTNTNTYLSKAVIASTGWGLPADDESVHIFDQVKELTAKLKMLMWNKVGVVRHHSGLKHALAQLDENLPQAAVSTPAELIRYLEYENMRCVAKMVCRAALERTESRRAHFRSDFPEEDNQTWMRNIVLRKTDSGLSLEKAPVTLDKVRMSDQ